MQNPPAILHYTAHVWDYSLNEKRPRGAGQWSCVLTFAGIAAGQYGERPLEKACR